MTSALTAEDVPSARFGLADQITWLRARREQGGVHVDAAGNHHVFSHGDVERVTKDPATFSSNPAVVLPPDVPNMTEGMMLVTDPPRHGKLRRLAAQAFTPRKMRDLVPRVAEISADLLGRVPSGGFDAVEHFTVELPATMIAELFGIPAADAGAFRALVEQIMDIDPPDLTDEKAVRAAASSALGGPFLELMGYLLQLCARRRAEPAPGLIGDLVGAQLDGERLGDQEVASLAVQILQAGHLTTAAVLGHALVLLAEHPHAQEELRADRSLIPAAVEEVLRCRPPSTRLQRYTTAATEVAGHEIPAGAVVVPWMLSANHDEAVFPEPDRFDVRRTPNRHLTFGHGVHFCLGATLARVEIAGALNALFDHVPQWTVEETVEYRESHLLFAPTRVPLVVSTTTTDRRDPA